MHGERRCLCRRGFEICGCTRHGGRRRGCAELRERVGLEDAIPHSGEGAGDLGSIFDPVYGVRVSSGTWEGGWMQSGMTRRSGGRGMDLYVE